MHQIHWHMHLGLRMEWLGSGQMHTFRSYPYLPLLLLPLLVPLPKFWSSQEEVLGLENKLP